MLSRLLVPDTVDYMIAGYVVVTLAVGIYLASLALRWKKARQAYQLYKNELDK